MKQAPGACPKACLSTVCHLLDKEMLKEFRFMLNYEFDSQSPMALVLVGQTELWDDKLRLQRYSAIRQRIDMYCTLTPLDRSECEAFMNKHLAYAGCTQDIFTMTAFDKVFQISGGIPRMIHRICEKSLMYAFQKQSRLIDDRMVSYVAEHEMLAHTID